jgi:hypothetical protein
MWSRDHISRFYSAITGMVLLLQVYDTSAASAQAPCEGIWSLRIEVQQGDPNYCHPSDGRRVRVSADGSIHRYSTTDSRGRNYTISGRVMNCDSVSFTVRRDADIARGTGAVKGRNASGQWAGQGRGRSCSGTWDATKN